MPKLRTNADRPGPQPELDRSEDVLDVDAADEVVDSRFVVTSFGADYPVDSLITRLDEGDIVIPRFDPEESVDEGIEGFQRDFVWKKSQMDKFIESLLLGLPVPGIFLVKQDH